MKAYPNRMLTIAALALVAVCASASSAAAQPRAQGKFTLTNEVTWHGVVLPPGDYTFSLESAAHPARLIVRGPKGPMFIASVGSSKRDTNGQSALKLERRGGARFVRELYLAPIGIALQYRLPKVQEKQLAQGPVTTEQVLVAMAQN